MGASNRKPFEGGEITITFNYPHRVEKNESKNPMCQYFPGDTISGVVRLTMT